MPPGPDAARSTYGLVEGAPEVVRVAACRESLALLRPVLSRVWIGVRAAGGAWPRELQGDAEQLLRWWAEERDAAVTVPRRPGAGPDVVGVDPRDSGRFALVRRLAPHSATVSAMSRDGKLVYDAGPDRWLLRLTADEHATLERVLCYPGGMPSSPGCHGWLTPVPKPVPAPGPWDWLVVPFVVVTGARLVTAGWPGTVDPSWSAGTAWSAVRLSAGVLLLAYGAREAVRAAVRWWSGRVTGRAGRRMPC